MDFATLKTEVGAWVLDLPADTQARLGTFVNDAVRKAADRYNFRFMESEITPTPLSTTANTRLLTAKPSDWKESRGLPSLLWQDGTTDEFDWAASESEMNRTFAYQIPQETSTAAVDSGQPRYLLEQPDEIWVYPLPDLLSLWANGNYRIRVPYWAYPATLTGDNDSNFITTNGSVYVIWEAVSRAFYFNRDEQRGKYFADLAEPEFRRIIRVDKRAQLPDRIVIPVRTGAYQGPSRSGSRRG
ncbi:MAG: phage adaptor protein [Gammaproteobacteria bacterium]